MDNKQVKVIRKHSTELMLAPFNSIRKGDTIFVQQAAIVCGEDAHKSEDPSYDGFLLYGEDGDSWFPEDLDGGPVIVAFCHHREAGWEGVIYLNEHGERRVNNGSIDWSMTAPRLGKVDIVNNMPVNSLIDRLSHRQDRSFRKVAQELKALLEDKAPCYTTGLASITFHCNCCGKDFEAVDCLNRGIFTETNVECPQCGCPHDMDILL